MPIKQLYPQNYFNLIFVLKNFIISNSGNLTSEQWRGTSKPLTICLFVCFLNYSVVSLREPFCLYCNKRNSIWEQKDTIGIKGGVFSSKFFFSKSTFYVFRDILCEKSYSMYWWANWVLLWTSQVKLPVSSSSFISLSGKVHWVGKFLFKNNIIVFNLGTEMWAV